MLQQMYFDDSSEDDDGPKAAPSAPAVSDWYLCFFYLNSIFIIICIVICSWQLE